MKSSLLRLGCVMAIALFSGSAAFAASQTWQGGTGNWSGTNWGPSGGPTGSAAPGATTGVANADTATFNTGTGAVAVDSGRNVKSITFDTAAGTYTLSGGSLVLTSGGAITLGTTATSFTGTNTTETINTPITLEGSYSFTNNSTTASDILSFGSLGRITNGATSTLTLSGANTGANIITAGISNGFGAMSLTKSGAGKWILSSADTFTGATSISAGTLQINNSLSLQNSTVSVSAVNGLTFNSGLGSATVFGLSGGSNEALVDTTGGNINLNITGYGAASITDTYSGVLSGAGTLSVSGFNLNQVFTQSLTGLSGTVSVNRNGAALKSTLSTSGDPFGTGNILVNGGTLSLAPGATGATSLVGATATSGNVFTYAGGAEVSLTRNGANNLTYTVGGGGTAAIARSGTGVLTILTNGVGLLDSSEFFGVNGTAPTVTNGMVNASIVGYGTTTAGNFDFLTYDTPNKSFQVATYTRDITTTGAVTTNAGELLQITPGAAQTITLSQGTGNAYALVVGPTGASGSTVISGVVTLGDGIAGHQAGLILNSNVSVTAGGTINFGANEGIVYVDGSYNYVIGVPIAGSGGVTFTGNQYGSGTPERPSNSNTFTGGVTFDGGFVLGDSPTDGAFGDASNSITFNGAATGGNLGPAIISTGRAVNITSAGVLFDGNNSDFSYAGNINGGTGVITISGLDPVVLTGNNTFGGIVIQPSGNLLAVSDASLGGATTPITVLMQFSTDSTKIAIMGTTLTSFGSHPVTVTATTGNFTLDIENAANTFGLGQFSAPVTLAKSGAGTLQLKGALSTSTLNSNGGITEVDSTQNGSLSTGTAAVFSGGTLWFHGNAGATLGAVTLNAGGGTLMSDSSSNITLGNIGTSTTAPTGLTTGGSSLLIQAAGSGGFTTTTAPDTSTGVTALTPGIYTGRIVFESSTGVYNWATSSSGSPTYTLSGYGNYQDLLSSNTTDNASVTNSEIISGSPGALTATVNSLAVLTPTAGNTFDLNADSIIVTSGGLLFTGTNAYTISDGTLIAGIGSNATNTDLIIQDYGAAGNASALTISAVIANATVANGGIPSGTSLSTLTKAGPGTVILAAVGGNTYTGATFINGGVLSIANFNELGATANSNINLNGGLLQVTTGGAVSGGTHVFVLGGSGGGFDLTNNTVLTVSTNIVGTYASSSEGGGLILNSSDSATNTGSVLVLSGTNSFSDGVTINSGTLRIGKAGALADSNSNNSLGTNGGDYVTFGSATTEALQLNGFSIAITGLVSSSTNAVVEDGNGSSTNATLTLNLGDNQTYAGTLVNTRTTGTGKLGLTKIGGGTMTLTNANSSYTGLTLIENGAISVSSIGNALSNGDLGAAANAAGASAPFQIGYGASTGSLIYTGTGETTNRNVNLAGLGGGAIIDQSGTGVLDFTGNFSATSSLNTVLAGAANKTLTLQGSTAGTGKIDGTIVDATVTGGGSGTTSVTKAGTSSWAVTGNNTYSGGTSVATGTFYANSGTGSSTGTGAVAVASGATLGGTGIIAPSGTNGVTVAAGGNLAPGGVQTTVGGLGGNPANVVNGSLTMNDTSITSNSTVLSASKNAGLTFAIGAGAPNSSATVSQLLVSGSVADIMNFNVGGTSGPGGTSTIVSINDLIGSNLIVTSGSSTEYILINGNNVTTYEDNGLTLALAGDLGASTALGQQILGGLTLLPSTAGNYFSQNYLSSHLFLQGDNIVLAVPEPGTWALMLGGLGLLAFIQRRKFNRAR